MLSLSVHGAGTAKRNVVGEQPLSSRPFGEGTVKD